MLIGSGVTADGAGKLLVLGLDREHLDKLSAGHTVRVTRETHGDAVPGDLTVVLLFGETVADIRATLAPFMVEPPGATQ